MSATTTAPSKAAAPKAPKLNRLGLERKAYTALESTLCAGCGHDSITKSIIDAFFDMGIKPYEVAKMSGIGCSSKTTAYFLNQSHGFNAIHGRMAAIAKGAALGNRQLLNIGVSGDGDTASIGLGNFLHMVRSNVPLIYIIENNGCYGLTKGQFSATAETGSSLKNGVVNHARALDCCTLAIEMGCGYVSRSFSGDFKQVKALIEGATAHRGTAVLDIISPCITFNDHPGSTKSYRYVKSHKELLHEVGFVPFFEEITVDYEPGEAQIVDMPDGSKITLRKLDHDYDPTDRGRALRMLHEAEEEEEHVFHTGLIYYSSETPALQDQMNMIDAPLATLNEASVRPDASVLEEIMESFR